MAFQARLQQKYKDSVRGALTSEFDIKNPMLVPALEKIVISVGAGDSAKDQKTLQNMADTISLIAGQKALNASQRANVCVFRQTN